MKKEDVTTSEDLAEILETIDEPANEVEPLVDENAENLEKENEESGDDLETSSNEELQEEEKQAKPSSKSKKPKTSSKAKNSNIKKNFSDSSDFVITNTSTVARSFRCGGAYMTLVPGEMRKISRTAEVEEFKRMLKTDTFQKFLDAGFFSVRGFGVDEGDLLKQKTADAPDNLKAAVPAGTSGIVASANHETVVNEHSDQKLKVTEEWIEQAK